MDLDDFSEYWVPLVGVYWFTPPFLTFSITGRPLRVSLLNRTKIFDKSPSASRKFYLSFRVPPSAAAEFFNKDLLGSSAASLRLSFPSAHQICRIHFSQAYHTHYVTLPGTLTLLKSYTSTYRGVLFHTRNAHGILPLQSFSLL